MIYAVYSVADNSLFSVCDNAKLLAPQDVLDKNGFVVKALDITNEQASGVWDTNSLEFLPKEEIEEIALDLSAVDLQTSKLDFSSLKIGESILVSKALDGSISVVKA